jgi:hypothetical protein
MLVESDELPAIPVIWTLQVMSIAELITKAAEIGYLPPGSVSGAGGASAPSGRADLILMAAPRPLG